MRAFVMWVLAVLGLLGSAAIGMYWWDRKRYRMGVADEKRARAERYKAKAASDEKRAEEETSLSEAQRLLRQAAEARARRIELEEERLKLARELSQELENDERARRFNLRHGLIAPEA